MKKINATHQINKIKEKKYDYINTFSKSIYQNSISIYNKISKELAIEGSLLILIMNISERPIDNVLLNIITYILNTSKTDWRTKKSLLTLIFNIIVEDLVCKNEKKKGKLIGKEEIKLSLFVGQKLFTEEIQRYLPSHH